MDLTVLIFIQLFMILLIGLIVYVSKKQRNFLYSYNLSLVILIVSIAKLFLFLWMFYKDYSLCGVAKYLYC